VTLIGTTLANLNNRAFSYPASQAARRTASGGKQTHNCAGRAGLCPRAPHSNLCPVV